MSVNTDHLVDKQETQQGHRTPLYELNASLGAKMTELAGYEMPLHFKAGALEEHLHTRKSAGLFDASYIVQIQIIPRSGDLRDAALSLERLVPGDILGLAPDRQLYTVLTAPDGGIVSDFTVANRRDHLLLFVNAERKTATEALLNTALSDDCEIVELENRALIALQGPAAEGVLERVAPGAAGLRFMGIGDFDIEGVACVVSRSGYTGEDGFEIGLDADGAAPVTKTLLEAPEVIPAGLSAHGTLRIEAGLCLYGSDIDETTSPVEAGLESIIHEARRSSGDREGGFPGADRVLAELRDGASRRRVGLMPENRAPIKSGAVLYAQQEGEEPIGNITSVCFSPSLRTTIAMGYVQTSHLDDEGFLFVEHRGRWISLDVVGIPFLSHKYER